MENFEKNGNIRAASTKISTSTDSGNGKAVLP